jgi:uncharacterized membrane protein (DUF2068 family)
VTVLGVLAIIVGILSILAGLLVVLAGAAVSSGAVTGSGVTASQGAVVTVLGGVTLVLGILYIILGIGFLGLRSWAWTLGVALSIISIVLDVVNMITSHSYTSNVISIIISAVILYYLYRPEVKAAFGRA